MTAQASQVSSQTSYSMASSMSSPCRSNSRGSRSGVGTVNAPARARRMLSPIATPVVTNTRAARRTMSARCVPVPRVLVPSVARMATVATIPIASRPNAGGSGNSATKGSADAASNTPVATVAAMRLGRLREGDQTSCAPRAAAAT